LIFALLTEKPLCPSREIFFEISSIEFASEGSHKEHKEDFH
jgi:hypothetical protein